MSHTHVMVIGKKRKRCKTGNELLCYQLKCSVEGCKKTKEVRAECVCRPDGKVMQKW